MTLEHLEQLISEYDAVDGPVHSYARIERAIWDYAIGEGVTPSAVWGLLRH